MRLDELLPQRPITISCEFFPTKSESARVQLDTAASELATLGPDFMTVTYGAGGSSRERTRDAVVRIIEATGLPAVSHLTCVGHTKDELRALFDDFAAAGIDNLLALRGDPPGGGHHFEPVPGGCTYASELLELIAADGRFATACAAFPEGHPEAASRERDWDHLRGKFEAGAVMAMTQCFFHPEPYLEMMAWLAARGGSAPRVVPGIMPIRSWPWLQEFVARFAPTATLPEALRAELEPLADDEVASAARGLELTIELCRDLLRGGAPGLHIYTLNRSEPATTIVETLRREDLLPPAN